MLTNLDVQVNTLYENSKAKAIWISSHWLLDGTLHYIKIEKIYISNCVCECVWVGGVLYLYNKYVTCVKKKILSKQ